MSQFRQLHHGWTVSSSRIEAISAAVPGCVHTDLLAAGLIDDPYLDDNENQLHWIGRDEWIYQTDFEHAGATDRLDLVCDGLDTVARVELNGVTLGDTANMHRGYRFDLREAIRPGSNRLRITFSSAYDYAEAQRERLGDRPGAYTEPYNFIRKMACNFGWDWGPTVVTAGIWQPIGLHDWHTARLADVRPLISVDGSTGLAEVRIAVERAGDAPLTVTATVAGVTASAEIAPGQTSAVVRLSVEQVELWWPRGYGSQARYPLDVVLRSGDITLDQWSRQVGFRTVRVDGIAPESGGQAKRAGDAVGSSAPDETGTPFTLVVNDQPVFVKGVNWIPDDTFVTRITRERLAERLGQARAANINFLRVWGGGRYESEDFYDLADEYGLLIGQDFLFACAAYPEEEPFASEVAAEACEQVARLASHPSLVMWVGNNENIWGHADWGWPEKLDGRSWGAGFYHEVLPSIVAELDPTRPYWPGSPYSGRPDLHPNEPAHGTMHIWDVWNRIDYAHYRDYVPRFVAEFGFQAPPAYATLRRAISDEPLASDSPGMRHHQKADDGDGKLARGLAAHLPEPRDFDDWHYLTQVNQARAVSLALEHFRSHQPVCMGAVVWQLNDCWPVTSWSAVDGDGRLKPLWHALRHSYADRLLTIQPRDGGLALIAVNDSAAPWQGVVALARHTLDGTALAKVELPIEVPARGALTVPLSSDLTVPVDGRGEVLRARSGDDAAWWFFAEDRDLDLPAAELDAVVTLVPGGYRVNVTARTLLRDLCLFPDRLDPAATVDTALVNLLPGEAATFTVSTDLALDPASLTSPPVLRCVNSGAA